MIQCFDNLICLAERASYLPLHSYLFGSDGAVNCDYIITSSINCLLIGSKCIPMAHILTIVEPIWPMLQNNIISKTLELLYCFKMKEYNLICKIQILVII